MYGNKKTFNIISISQKTFSIIIDGFEHFTTFVFNIFPNITIEFVSSAIEKLTQTFSVSKVRMIISQMSLIVSQTQTINVKKIFFTFLMSIAIKFSNTFKILVPISFVSRARLKSVTQIILKKITLTIVATLARFYTLGEYDPIILGTMDVETLGTLDYIAA